MLLKKSHLLLLASSFFAVAFASSFLIFDPPSQDAVVPLTTLEQINDLSQSLNEILEQKEPEKSATIQKMIDSGQYGDFKLLYRDWSVKLSKTGRELPQSNNIFFNRVGESEFSIAIPVGKYQVKGVIVATRKISSQEPLLQPLALQILFSFALTFLVLGWIVWIKVRDLVKPIDRLCQQFTKYRREQETSEINLPQPRLKQSPLERRVEILEDLWSRFQSIQEQLADKVEELKQSEAEKEKTIEELERAKEQERRLVELGYAVAEFGHDIGNANGAVITFSELLIKNLEKETIVAMDLARCLMYTRRIHIASRAVDDLKKDILEFATGKTILHLGKHDINDCVSQLEVILGFIGDLPVEYEIPSNPISLKIDRNKIIRVIVNLVKNAWQKFKESEGQIQISFLPDDQAGLLISVIDSGSPIPDTILHNLFQPFQTEGKTEGTGLGLAICKKIIESHGGQIKAENLPNKAGVRFSFYLPNSVLVASNQTVIPAPSVLEANPSPTE